MLHYYKFNTMPTVEMSYSVIRRTTWKTADPYHILLFIHNGHCVIAMNQQEYLLNPGDVFYIPKDQTYERRPVDNEFCEMMYIHFSLNAEGTLMTARDAKDRLFLENMHPLKKSAKMLTLFIPSGLAFHSDEKYVSDLFISMFHLSPGQNSCDQQMADSCLYHVLCMISQQAAAALYRAGYSQMQTDTRIRKALDYIALHYSEKITLDDLCNVSFMSKQMLIRHFNKDFGQSPMAYITEFKINKLKEMFLLYPNSSIKELCGEFGFDDQCYFSRIFKKITGETPSEFRARVTHFDSEAHEQGL